MYSMVEIFLRLIYQQTISGLCIYITCCVKNVVHLRVNVLSTCAGAVIHIILCTIMSTADSLAGPLVAITMISYILVRPEGVFTTGILCYHMYVQQESRADKARGMDFGEDCLGVHYLDRAHT